MRWLDGITNPMDMGLTKLLEMLKDRACHRPWRFKELYDTELLNNTKEHVILDLLSQQNFKCTLSLTIGTMLPSRSQEFIHLTKLKVCPC